MDKSWMFVRNRTLPEYVNGVTAFLDFAKQHMSSVNKIKCPCYKCNNFRLLTPDQVHDHLVLHGFIRSYDPWVHHGENSTRTTVHERTTNDIDHDECYDDNVEMVGDGTWEMLQELNNESLFNDWATSSTSNSAPGRSPVESNLFAKLFADASEQLYPGCKASRLAFIVKLLHLKIINGWSNKSFNMLLELLKEILPPGTDVPPSYYKAKQLIRDLGLDYVKIHACKNDCILFWNEYKDVDVCPTCNTSRYKCVSDTNKKIPHKILRYFPLKPRLQRLFVSSKTAKDMRWHHESRVNDGMLRHPADSEAWKHFDHLFPVFGSDPRNVKLGLASDGFNPFDNMAISYSMWPVILVPYNLPPWRCMKEPFLMLSSLIPGPKAPGNDIDVYLQPLVHELKELWEVGVETYDASINELFRLHAALLWTINDFPAYANLSGWSTKGKLACPVCNIDASFLSLKHGRKICYLGHRRFLPSNHKWRNSNWYGGKELRAPPKMLSGDDVLEQLNDVTQPTFGKPPDGSRKRKRAAIHHHWTKKSIFFELPYWRSLKLRHNLDVMHIEKNVCDSILGTLMNIEGKTKDTYNTRLDLEALGIMPELHPTRKDGAIYLPPACYMLNLSEKKKLCEFLSDVKLPDGYASNISRCVNLVDYKISGLKSHDCHILLQRLLPIALRGNLRQDVCRAIIHLCMFFRELTCKTLKMDILEQLDNNIAQTLSSLEKNFPPSFFDVMVHLPIHLAREAIIAGPCQFRWMYPFERYLHKLKHYIRNKAHPEGSIAEGYIDNECLTFCSMYLNDVETVFNRPDRNYDAGDAQTKTGLSAFSHNGHGIGAATLNDIDMIEWAKIRWYVLNNCDEAIPFINEHTEQLEREHVRDVYVKQQIEFPRWLLQRLNQVQFERYNDSHEDLKILARGPDKRVIRYSGCIINGHRFRTTKRDIHKKTQNSGVVAKGNHNGEEINFFGVLRDIIELRYRGNKRVFLFKCDWWDIGNRSRIHIDEYKVLSINVTRMWYKEDPYVIATQVEEVIYLPDPKMGKSWRVVERIQPRNLYDLQVTKATIEPHDEAYQQQECVDVDDDYVTEEAVEQMNRTDMDEIVVNVNQTNYEENLIHTFSSEDESEDVSSVDGSGDEH